MYRKELAYYFTTPIAYIVIGLYLLAVSLFLWVIPGQYNIVESGYAQLDGLFALSPWFYMLLCPALTMRLFAEERRSGMWDLLLTKPYPVWRMVAGKYMAALTLVVIAIVPCLVHYFLVAWMAEPMGNLDFGQFIGSIIGLMLLSAAYMGISLFFSSLSRSQIVCFILSAVACFVLYWLFLQSHYESMARGVLDTRDIVIMLSVAIAGMVATLAIIRK